MASFSAKSFERKLKEMSSRQDSVQTVSLWLIHHRAHSKIVVTLWHESVKKAKPERRLVLFYLANDVIQNSRKKGKEFSTSFRKVLLDTMPYLSDSKIRPSVERVLKIWQERKVFEKDLVQKLIAQLYRDSSSESKVEITVKEKVDKAPKEKPEKPKRPVPADFKVSKVTTAMLTMQELEAETQRRQIKVSQLRLDASSSDGIRQLKDRAGGNTFSMEFEESSKKIEDLAQSLGEESQHRQALINILEDSDAYYEAALEEANIIANAYRSFGNRLHAMKKKLDNKIRKFATAEKEAPVSAPKASFLASGLSGILEQMNESPSDVLESPQGSETVAKNDEEIEKEGQKEAVDEEEEHEAKVVEEAKVIDPTVDHVEVADMDIESDSENEGVASDSVAHPKSSDSNSNTSGSGLSTPNLTPATVSSSPKLTTSNVTPTSVPPSPSLSTPNLVSATVTISPRLTASNSGPVTLTLSPRLAAPNMISAPVSSSPGLTTTSFTSESASGPKLTTLNFSPRPGLAPTYLTPGKVPPSPIVSTPNLTPSAINPSPKTASPNLNSAAVSSSLTLSNDPAIKLASTFSTPQFGYTMTVNSSQEIGAVSPASHESAPSPEGSPELNLEQYDAPAVAKTVSSGGMDVTTDQSFLSRPGCNVTASGVEGENATAKLGAESGSKPGATVNMLAKLISKTRRQHNDGSGGSPASVGQSPTPLPSEGKPAEKPLLHLIDSLFPGLSSSLHTTKTSENNMQPKGQVPDEGMGPTTSVSDQAPPVSARDGEVSNTPPNADLRRMSGVVGSGGRQDVGRSLLAVHGTPELLPRRTPPRTEPNAEDIDSEMPEGDNTPEHGSEALDVGESAPIIIRSGGPSLGRTAPPDLRRLSGPGSLHGQVFEDPRAVSDRQFLSHPDGDMPLRGLNEPAIFMRGAVPGPSGEEPFLDDRGGQPDVRSPGMRPPRIGPPPEDWERWPPRGRLRSRDGYDVIRENDVGDGRHPMDRRENFHPMEGSDLESREALPPHLLERREGFHPGERRGPPHLFGRREALHPVEIRDAPHPMDRRGPLPVEMRNAPHPVERRDVFHPMGRRDPIHPVEGRELPFRNEDNEPSHPMDRRLPLHPVERRGMPHPREIREEVHPVQGSESFRPMTEGSERVQPASFRFMGEPRPLSGPDHRMKETRPDARDGGSTGNGPSVDRQEDVKDEIRQREQAPTMEQPTGKMRPGDGKLETGTEMPPTEKQVEGKPRMDRPGELPPSQGAVMLRQMNQGEFPSVEVSGEEHALDSRRTVPDEQLRSIVDRTEFHPSDRQDSLPPMGRRNSFSDVRPVIRGPSGHVGPPRGFRGPRPYHEPPDMPPHRGEHFPREFRPRFFRPQGYRGPRPFGEMRPKRPGPPFPPYAAKRPHF